MYERWGLSEFPTLALLHDPPASRQPAPNRDRKRVLWAAGSDGGAHLLPGDFSRVGRRKAAFQERATPGKGSLVLGRQVLGRRVRMGDDDLPHALREGSLDDRENLIPIQVSCRKDEIMSGARAQHASDLWKHLVLLIDDRNRCNLAALLTQLLW